MKIAVILTEFLNDYAKNYYQSLALNCELSYFIYKDFQDAGELYLALEPDYDGFLVSGPVPRAAICQRVPSLPKPLISFGSSPLCYYESFFQIQYNEKDFYLERGYYDLMEWYSGEPDRPLYDFLKRGEFHDLIMEIYQNTSSYSLEQLCEMEEKKKDISVSGGKDESSILLHVLAILCRICSMPGSKPTLFILNMRF